MKMVGTVWSVTTLMLLGVLSSNVQSQEVSSTPDPQPLPQPQPETEPSVRQNDRYHQFIASYNAMLANESMEVEEEEEEEERELDRAWLTINSTVNFEIQIWAQSDECYKCDLMLITTIPGDRASSIMVNASFPTDLRLVRVHPGGLQEQLCSFHETFREKGDYWVFVEYPAPAEATKCIFILANDPDIPELAILYVLIGLFGLAILYVIGKRLYYYARKSSGHKRNSMDLNTDHDGANSLRMSNGKGHNDDPENATKGEGEEPKKKTRLRSLDTFRGFTLMLMIFVNYGGGGYWFFEHAPWNGVHVADLVFPWFVFIMGASMNFSFKSMFNKGWSVPRITWRIVYRSAKIFVVGFVLATHHYVADLPTVRVMGVLQRLALTYLISSLIHFCCSRKFDSHQDRKWAPVRDILLYLPEWLANLAILGIHLGIIYGLPVPGCPTGYVGPGGLSEGGVAANCTGGATQYVDAVILGEEHMYRWPTPMVIYQTTIPFDPEGILGTLNCVFLCFLGIQFGRIVLLYQEHKQRIIRFIVWAVVLGALGALLTKCSQNEGWIPANKNIWSLSYSLITGAFAYVLLSAMYVVVDVWGIWHGQPFIYMGMNSIVIYFCHSAFYKQFPVSWVVGEEHWKLLLLCTWSTAVWVMFGYWLFYKKIFIAL
ncbi:heparan-alpha-glucosaminide N-acetyltransferase [Aplysia californica]|uniref:Heparan-alpha-glucosaminide N-acetyltransferase n=1 Tax=Aplysia californica TaxID=6500 RepID=A0ABM0ZU93_APLCA|nr:heparan-alpha-glucosaminide N-acetyltransferase [Aplysia californica]